MTVTNTMYQAAPWADALYAMDAPWWALYGADVAASFRGQRFSAKDRPPFAVKSPGLSFGNSGAAALALAAAMGAKRIVMVGYDCQRTGGRAHSHGDHPPQLGNAKSLPEWPKRFAKAAEWLRSRGVDVVNCSRATALTCFRRGNLEDELCRP